MHKILSFFKRITGRMLTEQMKILNLYLLVKSNPINVAHLKEHIVVYHGKVGVIQVCPNDCITINHRRL